MSTGKYAALNRIKRQSGLTFRSLFWLSIVFISGCAGISDASRPINSPVPVDREKAAQARLALGLAYLERDNLKQAYLNLRKAADYSGDNYQTHLAMALYEQRIGEYDNARRSYEAAFKLAPNQGDVLNRYGAFLCKTGDYAQAQRLFDLALNTTNYDMMAAALENIGYCYLEQKQYLRAQEFLSRALKHEPAKSKNLLVVTEHYLTARQHEPVAVLLDIYQQNSPITAESLWLQIRFASLNGDSAGVERYGRRLAEHFSHSEQYKQFLAHEN